MSLLLGILAILGILLAVVLVTALAVSAIVRDKKTHGTSGTLSSAMLEVQSILEPGKKNVVETMHQQKEQSEEDESGED